MRAPPHRPVALALALASGLVVVAPACRPSRPPQPGLESAPSPPHADAATPSAPELAAVPPPRARTMASGVAIDVLDAGDPSAPLPRSGDVLELRFRVWNEDGKLLAASRADRSERLSTLWLPVGWAEAMYTLHVGAHAHVWVPAAQAYAALPAGPRGDLRIDVQLVAIEPLPELPNDIPLSIPPPNALRTASGMHFLVLRPGSGMRHPKSDARVTVHYDGWTSDGNRFDSSYLRDKPTTFPLTAVIAGWQEAVPLMVEGEKTRFWIPPEMAYGNSPGKPNGMLIFDIELLKIED